ncbi:MAG: SDR family oxidoreductase [Planctomycetes bacterium]|nr:SDR family oxidoreductase [Planctomycetota bacterium]
MIFVTGASGTNGRPLVERLRARGVALRLLTRDAKKLDALRGAGVEVVSGDLAEPASYAAALRGCERAFLLSAVSQRIAEQEGAFATAAAQAGVRQVVKFSANGADPKSPYALGRMHGQAEAAVAASGIAWCALRPTFFQQNLLWAAGSIKKDGTFRNNLGDARAAHVDVRDLAAVAAAILTAPIAAHAGKVYELRGPEALTFAEIATLFTQVVGKPVRYVNLTDAEYAAGMVRAGLPEWLATAIAELAAVARDGSAARLNDHVRTLGGKEPTTVAAFLAEHRAALVG